MVDDQIGSRFLSPPIWPYPGMVFKVALVNLIQ